jgi:hypothetical protein
LALATHIIIFKFPWVKNPRLLSDSRSATERKG